MGAHEDSVLAHIPYRWSYANAGARTGAGGFVAGDVGKFARQTDNNTIWMLIATTPTWIFIGGGDGSDLPYTPADINDWDYLADPGDVPEALDQLADRVESLEIAPGGVSDAADLTYTPNVLADWNASSDPGNADDAFDQLAARTKDLEDTVGGPGGTTDFLIVQVFS